MKVSDLNGTALDWAVAKAENETLTEQNGFYFVNSYQYSPSTIWAQGGAIIEREWLDITPWANESREDMRWHCQQHDTANDCAQYGETPLIAAMRCYVASKLGDEIDIPKEIQADSMSLSDDEILAIADMYLYDGGKNYSIIQFGRAIEARAKDD